MKIQIKLKFSDKILFGGEYESVKHAIENAVNEGANLYDANLKGASLEGAKNLELACALVTILPEGELIGWKKCRDGEIIKLRIPADALRSNGTGRKCRANYVEVLEVFGGTEGKSTYCAPDGEILTYKKGEIVRCVKPFDENRFNECSSGIHFYITRIEAENHN